MRTTLACIAIAVVALLVAASASATSRPESVHGGAIHDFPDLGFDTTWRLSVSVNRLPTGNLVGAVNVTQLDSPLTDDYALGAKPVYLETHDDIRACLVADVERFRGDFFFAPARIVLNILDTPVGDTFAYQLLPDTASDPAELCLRGEGFIVVSQGGFAVNS